MGDENILIKCVICANCYSGVKRNDRKADFWVNAKQVNVVAVQLKF